jgi:hypothetical protein
MLRTAASALRTSAPTIRSAVNRSAIANALNSPVVRNVAPVVRNVAPVVRNVTTSTGANTFQINRNFIKSELADQFMKGISTVGNQLKTGAKEIVKGVGENIVSSPPDINKLKSTVRGFKESALTNACNKCREFKCIPSGGAKRKSRRRKSKKFASRKKKGQTIKKRRI